MAKKTSTKRALVLSALAILMCVSMLIGSTFAWFTDSVTSARNQIVSGNLDIELEYSTWDADNNTWSAYAPVDANTKIFNENALYEPGYTEVVKFKVENAGSLALKYNMSATIYREEAGINVYNEPFNLSDYIYTGKVDVATITDRATAAAQATEKLGTGLNMAAGTSLLPGASEEFALVLTMPTTVGNEANHIDGHRPSIEFGIALVATQYTYEEDDFGKDYDEMAFVATAEELVAALTDANVDGIVLTSDVTLTENVNITSDKTITLNGNDFVADSGSRPFFVYGADLAIDATGSNIELDKYGLVDIKEGTDVNITIIGGTITGQLDNGAVIKGRTNTSANIYLENVNMTFTDTTGGSYIYNPADAYASATTTIDGGVYNIDCGTVGNAVIKNATINAQGFIFNGGGSIENSTLTTDGSSKAPASAAPFCCVAASYNRTVTVTNSTLTATNCNAVEVYPSGGIVTITGSTVTGTCYVHPLYTSATCGSITIDGVEQ